MAACATCYKCGRPIEFRTIKGKRVPIHEKK